MIAMREWMLPLICSAIIVVIQIIFAPILNIFSVVPSFIVAFVLVLSVSVSYTHLRAHRDGATSRMPSSA